MVAVVTTIPMNDFSLKWRFIDPKYRMLPAADLEQIKPLDKLSASRLLDFTSHWCPMPPTPRTGFSHVVSTPIEGYGIEGVARVQEWLFLRGVPRKQQVFASWSRHEAATTAWENLVKNWNAFWYPSSDDLLVFDESLEWALFIWHEERAFFGCKAA